MSEGKVCFPFFIAQKYNHQKKKGIMAMKEKLSYEVIKHIGTISEKNNYSKEVNVIAWNGRPAVFDIRCFRVGEDGEKYPLKGISMNKDDLVALKELLSCIDLEG